jgi:hypothetical protein
MFESADHRKQLAATRAADRRHIETMTAVAKRGGLTLDQLHALNQKDKEAFIFKHGNRKK